MNIIERIAALRTLMKQNNLSAYIVPGNDPHASEYMAPHWMEMSWITGFLGETGTAVITLSEAFLWTDSRYYLQAEQELQGTSVTLMRESDVDCPSITEWLSKHIQGTVGVNPEMYSVNGYNQLRKELNDSELDVLSIDLIGPIWTENRPDIPMNPLYIYDDKFAGESVESKLARVRAALAERRCDAAVVAELDEIGWLLNVRGSDVDFTPCVICYVVVERDTCTLFVDSRKLNNEVQTALHQKGITIRAYEDVFAYLKTIQSQGILLDGNRVNEALYEAINAAVTRKVNATPSPIQVMMSIKNDVEIAGEKKAMLTDAVALTRFFRWLDTEAMKTPQTEMTLANQLHTFRAMGENFKDESFCTIAGWNGNGAIVHYHATDEGCAKIEGNGVLLLDSGGQYLDGTTDITRTVWVGNTDAITAQLRRDYTLVMKGHIALAKARFPKGTRGNQLDVLAHQYMWQDGVSYGHGTGHGVGHFMGCHEGPANIRMDNNTNPIRLGNIFSDEPGIYRTGEYGIRTENLIVTREAKTDSLLRSTGEQYYEFETITLCFYDVRLLDMSMLTNDEIAWINDYHQRVYDAVSPLLNEEEKQYLADKCQAIRK
ncbi:MAG: aminopeptidase P family N-terminal domain-containing protein [Bacteroidales bacterium]|nr:aminopeptidase P family N-terminal domain-containing protein [Candidatus Colicola coprequi]